MSKIELTLEIDLEELKETIESCKDLNNSQELFSKLTEVYKAKQQVNDVLDRLISIEADAKNWIENKANALYGKEWTAIKGDGYKISKSFTGSVFNILPDTKPPKQFVKIKETLDSKLVENFIKETGKLPKGIEYNPQRGTSIRVTING